MARHGEPAGSELIGLDPTSGPPDAERRTAASRRASLDGAVLGLVANGLGESAALMRALYDEVRRVAPIAGAVAVEKSSVSVPPEPEDWERLTSEATVAIAGFGG